MAIVQPHSSFEYSYRLRGESRKYVVPAQGRNPLPPASFRRRPEPRAAGQGSSAVEFQAMDSGVLSRSTAFSIDDSVRSRPSISSDSNSGGATRRPDVATLIAPKSWPALRPSSFASGLIPASIDSASKGSVPASSSSAFSSAFAAPERSMPFCTSSSVS